MSSLFPFCRAFEDKPYERRAKLLIMFQHWQTIETDPDELSELANDTHLKCVLDHIYSVITEEKFPSPSQGIVPQVLMQSLQHLTVLAVSHPDLLKMVAGCAPMDYLPMIFFGNNFSDGKIVEVQASHLLNPIRFLAAISFSQNITITSTDAMHVLFSSLFSVMNDAQLTSFACAAIAGFAHNSPSALAYMRSLPNFNLIRPEISSHLSSDDHSIVLSSLACLTGLFKHTRDSETLMKAAIHGIIHPPSFPVATQLAVLSVKDLLSKTPLIKGSISNFVNVLINKSIGMRSLSIITLLNDLLLGGFEMGKYLEKEGLINKLLDFSIKTPFDFVSAACTKFLSSVFEMDDTFCFKDIDELFIDALKIVVSPLGKIPLLKIESMLLSLYLMLKNNEKNETVNQALIQNDDQVFLAFQRYIESNSSFLCVNFFLFLCRFSDSYPKWKKRIQTIIVDSQFAALLVHVMTHAQNRSSVSDAVNACFILMSGLNSSVKPNILIDTVVSGFCVMNKTLKEEEYSMKGLLQESINKVQHQSRELHYSAERNKNAVSLITDEKNKLSAIIKEKDDIISQLENDLKEEKLHSSKKQGKVRELKGIVEEKVRENGLLQSKIEGLTTNIADLRAELNNLHQTIARLTSSNETLKLAITDNSTSEKEVENLKCEIESSKKMIETLNMSLESERQGRRRSENQLYEMSNKASELSDELRQKEKQLEIALQQLKRFEVIVKKKADRLAAMEDVNRKLREEVTELEDKLDISSSNIKKYRKATEEMQDRLVELENQRNKHDALYQFIHNITEKAARIDPNTLSESKIYDERESRNVSTADLIYTSD